MQDTFETLNDHYDNLKAELGYETVFDAMDTVKPLD